MTYKVEFSPAAYDDLDRLFDFALQRELNIAVVHTIGAAAFPHLHELHGIPHLIAEEATLLQL